MDIPVNTRQAYTEVDSFLSLLDDETKNKIPQELQEIFKKEKDLTYQKEIDVNIPISEQNLKEEALTIIALLNMRYWCETEEEKQRLEKVYAENEEKYQKEAKEKYNADAIFESRNEKANNANNINNSKGRHLALIDDIPWYKKILSTFKSLFKKKKH